ncbi:MAG TPA: hypothetical protein VMW58_07175 [Anaerolineae bacterium]|nr:hypothetical protein [Anaerolineae bacterium]
MKVRKSLLAVMILVSFCSAGERALAAPAPPELVVNHGSKQCAEFWAGDECFSCSAPAGWEILGRLPEAECPDGYTEVEIDRTCSAHKVDFCCTEGHSGAPGDCEDVVINRAKEQCAFVEDIGECPALPRGWERHGVDCPYYEWADQVDCFEKDGGGTVEGGGLMDNARMIVASVLCLLACSLPLAVLLIVLGVWLWRRRSSPSPEATGR